MKTRALLVAVSLCLFLACTKETDIYHPDPLFPQSTEFTSTLFIRVVNEYGSPVPGARVTIGSFVKESDNQGWVNWADAAVTSTTLISVSKENFFKCSRRIRPSKDAPVFVKFILQSKNLKRIISSTEEAVIAQDILFQLHFPKDAYQLENGDPYSGKVNIYFLPLSIDDPDLPYKMPGDLTGLNKDDSICVLGSLGMIGVELESDSGAKLNLRGGKTVEIKIQVSDDRLGKVPPTIPMWYFDETIGVWKEEGEAHLQGNYYIANVSHFSYWNYDVQFERVNWSATFNQEDGTPLSYGQVTLTVDGIYNTVHGSLDQSGRVQGPVPKNQMLTMQVTGQCGEELFSGKIGPYADDFLDGIFQVENQTQVSKISGTVYNCDHHHATNGYVWVYADYQYYQAALDLSGSFSVDVYSCSKDPIFIQAFDGDRLATSSPQKFNATQVINIDSMFACIPEEEYLIIQPENWPHTLMTTNVYVENSFEGCPFGLFAENDAFEFSMCLKSLLPGFYPHSKCLLYAQLEHLSDTFPTIATIHYIDLKIEKAGVHGGFVEGSFKGKLILNPTNDPAPTLPFTARFRVKRDH